MTFGILYKPAEFYSRRTLRWLMESEMYKKIYLLHDLPIVAIYQSSGIDPNYVIVATPISSAIVHIDRYVDTKTHGWDEKMKDNTPSYQDGMGVLN